MRRVSLFAGLFVLCGCQSASSPTTTSPATTTYSQQVSRHRELGDKYNPTQEELREYLLLDGRLGVQEGQWSKDDFERWTKEKY